VSLVINLRRTGILMVHNCRCNSKCALEQKRILLEYSPGYYASA